jgi:hypothetical protein
MRALGVLVDGVPLPADEARAFWQRFSAWMNERAGDLAGFARAESLASVRPEIHDGEPVLIASRTAAQMPYAPALKKSGRNLENAARPGPGGQRGRPNGSRRPGPGPAPSSGGRPPRPAKGGGSGHPSAAGRPQTRPTSGPASPDRAKRGHGHAKNESSRRGPRGGR